jgi:hypothetical protein
MVRYMLHETELIFVAYIADTERAKRDLGLASCSTSTCILRPQLLAKPLDELLGQTVNV